MAALGEYVQTDFAQPAVTFYFLVFVLNNISWILITQTAMPLYRANVNMKKVSAHNKNVIIGGVIYLFTFILSFWFPLTALTLISATFILWLVIGIRIKNYEIEEAF